MQTPRVCLNFLVTNRGYTRKRRSIQNTEFVANRDLFLTRGLSNMIAYYEKEED
jgi:hypothetical protein